MSVARKSIDSLGLSRLVVRGCAATRVECQVNDSISNEDEVLVEAIASSLESSEDGEQTVRIPVSKLREFEGAITFLDAQNFKTRSHAATEDAAALIEEIRGQRRVTLIGGALGVAILVTSSFIAWKSWQVTIALGLVSVPLVVAAWGRSTLLLARVKGLHARAAVYAAFADVKGPNDLPGLLRANRQQMDAYDISARRQGSASHWASIAAMTVGLAIVGIGLWIAVTADKDAAKYSAAIIAVAGTAAGGYIAQTFIRVHSTAQEQVRFYFEQPLVQSYMLMAERAIAQMPAADQSAQFEKLVDAAVAQAAMVPRHRVGAPLAPEPAPAVPPDVRGE